MARFQGEDIKQSWLKEQEVASMIGVSLSTLRKWRMLGINLPCHKLGRSVRYSREDIVAFMARRLVPVR